jgi:hypothetical protein
MDSCAREPPQAPDYIIVDLAHSLRHICNDIAAFFWSKKRHAYSYFPLPQYDMTDIGFSP